MSDRAAAKARTRLHVAVTQLDEAGWLARPAGLPWPADTLAQLVRDATEALTELPAVPHPTPLVDPAVGNHEQRAGS